jgi:hypothetical protein
LNPYWQQVVFGPLYAQQLFSPTVMSLKTLGSETAN